MAAATTRILRPSRPKTVGYLTLSAVFTIVGVRMVADGEWRGWFAALFFGLGVIVLAVNLLPNSAYLRVGLDGFTVRSLYRSLSYRWSDVGPFSVDRIGPKRMVVFNFSEEYRAQPLGRQFAVAIAGFEGGLPDSYGSSLEELADLLNAYRQKQGAVPNEVLQRSRSPRMAGSAPLRPGKL